MHHPLFTDGRLLQVLPAGSHSEVALYRYQDIPVVLKRCGQHYAHFTEQEAVQLAQRIIAYYAALQQAGVPIPDDFACWVEGSEACLLTRYGGPTLRQADIPPTRLVLEQVLDLWARVVAAPENASVRDGNLLLSVELSPDNVCQQVGKLLFIDFTPPLWKTSPIDTWPLRLIPRSESEESPAWKDARYFKREGVLLTFLTKFWAAWPEQADLLCETLSAFLRGRTDGTFLSTFFNQSPAASIARAALKAREDQRAGRADEAQATVLEAARQIAALGPAERDQLRLLALILAPESPTELTVYLARTTLTLPTAEPELRAVLRAILALKGPGDHARLQSLVTALLPFAWRPFQV